MSKYTLCINRLKDQINPEFEDFWKQIKKNIHKLDANKNGLLNRFMNVDLKMVTMIEQMETNG